MGSKTHSHEAASASDPVMLTGRSTLLARLRKSQRGNTMVLFPMAVLVLFGLGAIALDSATVFLAQRRLSDLAASVSHDAVAGINEGAFYGGNTEISGARASAREAQLRPNDEQDQTFENVSCSVTTGTTAGSPSATADCTATVRPFLASFWGMRSAETINASETSIGVEG